jgi:hypothetical protein
MAQTPETRIKNAVKAFLKARGVWYCSPVTGGFGMQGLPDILCCWNGFFVGIETKAPGQRSNTTALQKAQLRMITDAEGVAVVIDDVAQMVDLENHVLFITRLRDRFEPYQGDAA